MILSQLDSDFLRYLLALDCRPGDRLPSLEEMSAVTGISVGKLREQFEVARVPWAWWRPVPPRHPAA